MLTVLDTDLSGSAHILLSDTPDADVLVAPGVRVATTGSTAIQLQASLHDLNVQGQVAADNYGVVLGAAFAADHGNTLRVGADGRIEGGVLAAAAYGSSATVNAGVLVGGDIGLRLNMAGDVRSSVVNAGLIQGGDWGIDTSAFIDCRVTLVNDGAVRGAVYSYVDRGGAADRIVNRGLLDGDVNLYAGSDRLDNRDGRILGEVLCGTGDDTVLVGSRVEILHGGDGLDTLDFRHGDGLRLSLVTGTGNGLARGDHYDGFERVLGSRTGDDALTGDGWDNVLEGFGGRDVLRGAGGEDRLVGGRGADTLRGGSEGDAFVFLSARDGGDRILDFDRSDRLVLDADGFGAGLDAGALDAARFRARADNEAQDANDRVVFRTTDHTLWFDADGSGAKAAVLLADLQDGAVVTAHDIWLA